MAAKTYYLTTAIPYANADPHIGHAILFLYGDVMARFQRLLGTEVHFLAGTDEHGQKMFKTAKEIGRDPGEYAQEESAVYERLLDEWSISNTDFIRTTEARHKTRASKFWEAVASNGDIYKKAYVGLYCYGCESFKTEKDLVEDKCPDHNRVPEEIEEENYFFRLSRYQEPLEFLFANRPDFILPKSRYHEMKNILHEGLADISVSRDRAKLPWGIPVPGDDTQVMYVWFDALLNYLTAIGYGSPEEAVLFARWWPGVHLVGKEINRFHSLLWPAMLMSAGVEVPCQVVAHGWITVDGQKMSKTVGNVIDPLALVARYPLDAVRYHLMREIAFDGDGNFSYRQLEDRYTGDLANGLGNLVQRILAMLEKYTGGLIPPVTAVNHGFIDFLTQDVWPLYMESFENWRFDRGLEAVWRFIAYCDQQISDQTPWSKFKAGKTAEVNDLLYHLCEALRHIAVMVWPVMPGTAERVFEQLGLVVEQELGRPLSALQQWVGLTVGATIKKGASLFPRLT